MGPDEPRKRFAMTDAPAFFNLYRHDFARIAVGVPRVRVADPAFNARETISLMREADKRHALLTLFPELGLSAYACDDLFQQHALLDACLAALNDVLEASKTMSTIAVVGLPLSIDGMLFNCAAVIHRGRLFGLVPKSYLPNYREFYEARQFSPASYLRRHEIDLLGQRAVPCSDALVFRVEDQPLLGFHVEICEDVWVPVPPSSFAALAGATVLLNLSASNVTVGKADFRRLLASSQSARCLAAYAYSAAGYGESTTDLAWDGHGMIYENGNALAETRRFADEPQLICADIDLGRLTDERMRQTTFGDTAQSHREACSRFRTVDVPAVLPRSIELPLARTYERFPYVPADPARRGERCREIYDIQVQGLVTRMRAAKTSKLVIGVSGGLDSTQALLVCARAVDMQQLPREAIVACILPGFGTGQRTLDQARRLVSALGCRSAEIDIRPSCMQMFQDIGHPFARGEPVHDVTFENVQAGERTSHLFRMANLHGALVVGTGDLSELALGWCTYGVGDHMSHYGVNSSVPKTLIQYLIRWTADEGSLGKRASAVLRDVLETEISPELIPAGEGGAIQSTEATVGPYELQDFNLYYLLRFGYRPSKVAFLAWTAWHDVRKGVWPDLPEEKRHEYGIADIKRWLAVFLRRFFEEQQFKRSCLPNGPKVGSGGSLSPRGDYRAPSDATARVWVADLETVPDREPGRG
jgi:NAD+ synthase (glutamine-hydrolysing)